MCQKRLFFGWLFYRKNNLCKTCDRAFEAWRDKDN